MATTTYKLAIKDVEQAALRLKNVVVDTPLMKNLNISKRLGANVFLKREDLQLVRSYKIRGAYNKISSLSKEELQNGVVCASAGNHAQGVAYSCNKLKIKGTIFMPAPTPKQKVEQVKMFGEDFVEVILQGDTFDDSQHLAADFCKTNNAAFIHPFDDEKVIEGQATIGLEILEQMSGNIDYLFLPIGGGGLAAGVSSVFKQLSPNTKIIGVEPKGAPSMSVSIQNKQLTKLDKIDKFVDGAAVKQVGELTYNICKDLLDDVVTVDEGKVCDTILKLYNRDAIVVEPAGALTIAVLDHFANVIKDKNVVCLVSGSNNDITRMEDIKERAMLYNGLKHYFLVGFPQRAGALKEFVAEVLGPTDDITYFEYTKKTSREKGFAVVGIELKNQEDFEPLLQRMKERHFFGDYLNDNEVLLDILI
ncbi:MAG: threonine ammonia-lyase [Vicingus serpentipes]|nr:threonine ammonia-lyase [Vicingus serpentipes]